MVLSRRVCALTFTLLFVTMFFTQTAGAALAPMLPESSYYDGYVWYGLPGTPEDSADLRGRIDFAVYNRDERETKWSQEEGDFVDYLGLSEEDTFIYAYQIFNDYGETISESAIAYFSVLGIDGSAIAANGTSSHNDLGYTTDPTDLELAGVDASEIPLDKDGVWYFRDEDPEEYGVSGTLISGEHSFFLAFSSDADWTAGSYELSGHVDVLPVTGEEIADGVDIIPEPATIILLGIGGLLTAGRKR